MPFTLNLIFVIIIHINIAKTNRKSMADGEIIWRFLDKNYENDNPNVYLYCAGQKYSLKTGTSRIYNEIEQIFCPPMDTHLLKKVIEAFLDNKRKLYKEGKIKIKSIY
jgi:hypothetical protein